MRAEPAGRDFRAERAQFPDNRVEEWFGNLRRRGLIPRWTTSFAGVGVQRELADHEEWRGGVGTGLLVVENSQRVKLSCQGSRLLDGVGVSDANEDDEPGSADFANSLAFDDDPRCAHALDDGPHGVIVARR